MKLKELETKIGEEVVYDPPGRFADRGVVTVVRIVPKGTVSVAGSGGYWTGGKNKNPHVEIEFPNGYRKTVVLGHISSFVTPDEFRELEVEAAAFKAREEARRADEKARAVAVEDRLVKLGVITELPEHFDYNTETYVPGSRLRYHDKLELSLDELERLVALLPEEAA